MAFAYLILGILVVSTTLSVLALATGAALVVGWALQHLTPGAVQRIALWCVLCGGVLAFSSITLGVMLGSHWAATATMM